MNCVHVNELFTGRSRSTALYCERGASRRPGIRAPRPPPARYPAASLTCVAACWLASTLASRASAGASSRQAARSGLEEHLGHPLRTAPLPPLLPQLLVDSPARSSSLMSTGSSPRSQSEMLDRRLESCLGRTRSASGVMVGSGSCHPTQAPPRRVLLASLVVTAAARASRQPSPRPGAASPRRLWRPGNPPRSHKACAHKLRPSALATGRQACPLSPSLPLVLAAG